MPGTSYHTSVSEPTLSSTCLFPEAALPSWKGRFSPRAGRDRSAQCQRHPKIMGLGSGERAGTSPGKAGSSCASTRMEENPRGENQEQSSVEKWDMEKLPGWGLLRRDFPGCGDIGLRRGLVFRGCNLRYVCLIALLVGAVITLAGLGVSTGAGGCSSSWVP